MYHFKENLSKKMLQLHGPALSKTNKGDFSALAKDSRAEIRG
jgi:hypothetical protein